MVIKNNNQDMTAVEQAKDYEAAKDPFISKVTESYMKDIASCVLMPEPETAASELWELTSDRLEDLKAWKVRSGEGFPCRLTDWQVAVLIMEYYDVAVFPHVHTSGNADYSMLTLYPRAAFWGPRHPAGQFSFSDAYRLKDAVQQFRPAEPAALWEDTLGVMRCLYLEATLQGKCHEVARVAGCDGIFIPEESRVHPYIKFGKCSYDVFRPLRRRKRPEDKGRVRIMDPALQVPDDGPDWDRGTGRWMLWRERL